MKKLLLALLLVSMPVCYGQDNPSAAAKTVVDTFHGMPVDATLNPEDAESYVDSLIQAEVPGHMFVNPQKLVPLGLINLLVVYHLTDPSQLNETDAGHRGMGLNPATQKRVALERAIKIVATPNDIDTLLDLYHMQPIILDVFAMQPDWDSNPKVVAFLNSSIDDIPHAYRRSNVATKSLLTMLNRSTDPDVQTKFSNFLFNTTQQSLDGRLAVDLITTYLGTENPNPVLAKNLSNVLSTLADHVSAASDNETSDTRVLWQDAYNPLMIELHTHLNTFLALASDSTNRDSLHRIAQIIKRDDNPPAKEASNLLLAIAGDQEAFKNIVKWCQSNPNSARTVTFDYLKTTKGASTSDPLAAIAASVDNAVYDASTATWSIPNTAVSQLKSSE